MFVLAVSPGVPVLCRTDHSVKKPQRGRGSRCGRWILGGRVGPYRGRCRVVKMSRLHRHRQAARLGGRVQPHRRRRLHPVAAAGGPQPARLRGRDLDARGGRRRGGRPAGAGLPPEPSGDHPELPGGGRGLLARSRLRAAHRHPPLQGQRALPSPAAGGLDPPALTGSSVHLPDGSGRRRAEPGPGSQRLCQSGGRGLGRAPLPPGSDLFVVYNQVWDTEGGLRQASRSLQLKLSWFWKR